MRSLDDSQDVCRVCGERIAHDWPDYCDAHKPRRLAMKCECNITAYDHDAGECGGTGSIRVLRRGVELLVCADCILSSDKELEPKEAEA